MFSSKSKEKTTPKKTTKSNPSPSAGAVSVLIASTTIEGNFDTENDLRLEGTVKGEVTVNGKVVLGESGLIEGTLNAAEAVIHGRVVGNLYVNHLLQLASTAVIEGDISASQFSVQEGAVYRGKCNIGKGV
ncbi:MAG TPA: polymer-forming cytoskeletal protein [Saprospiraceae bacterium]|nr:polymer-forming cytoskeletal protein [Saprospiraceae bacterium]